MTGRRRSSWTTAVEMPIHQNIDLVMTDKTLSGLTWSGGGFEYFGAGCDDEVRSGASRCRITPNG